jgi:hypothetical protein
MRNVPLVLALPLLFVAGLARGADTSSPFPAATQTFAVEYVCSNKQTGEGCRATCATATFSPILRLAVILYSIKAEDGNKYVDFLYYKATFSENADGDSSRPKFAEGFILGTNSLCGAVNMQLGPSPTDIKK